MMAVVPVPMPTPSAAIPRPEPPRQHPTILDGQSLELPAGWGAEELVELADEHLDAVGEEDVARDLCADSNGRLSVRKEAARKAKAVRIRQSAGSRQQAAGSRQACGLVSQNADE